LFSRLVPTLLLLCALALSGWGLYVVNAREGIPEKAGDEIEALIVSGQSAAEVASEFAKLGVVTKSRDLSRWMVKLGFDRRIKPGIYRIHAGRAKDVALELSAAVPEVLNVRILPGALFEDVAASFGDDGVSLLTEALSADENFPEPLRGILPADARSRISLLAPETYETLPGGGSAMRLVKKASDMWWLKHGGDIPRNFTSRDIAEEGVLASIVQKEAMVESDRPIIAGVFKNRLSMDMPLQSCATVVHAWKLLGVRKTDVNYDDVKIDSPFNTYIHKGLPPENIGIPSENSWGAVLKPVSTDMLFFVAKGDGSHVFTRTYAEHLAAQKKIRREER
jgi:UPF0755 protein